MIDSLMTAASMEPTVVVDEVTLAVGESTGWHYHVGPLLVVVRSGTLTRYDRKNTRCQYGPSAIFVEPAGAEEVHMGRNEGRDPVVLLVAFALPAGADRSIDAPPPAPLKMALAPSPHPDRHYSETLAYGCYADASGIQ